MIRLENLNKIYTPKNTQLHTLKDVNLTVATGEIVGLIGKSGAGKSTLLRCVNLLERPTSGRVFVDNTDMLSLNASQLRQARHQIGMVFQHFNLLSRATVFENVAFPLRLLHQAKSQIQKKVFELLDKVGLLAFAKSYPHQLSGGQKQRVAIARALATKPTILLCDEMTSALDPETTDDILALVRQLNREMQLSILCVTHEMEVVKSIADRVAVIDAGEIVECQPVALLFKNPKTDIAKRLTQSVLKTALPMALQKALHEEPSAHDHVVLRFIFAGETTLSPLVNEWMRTLNVSVNILQATIEKLRDETIGCMIVSLPVDQDHLEKAMQFFRDRKLGVEVLGYVNEYDWSHC